MRYSSEKASIKHVPALFRFLEWKKGTKNLDYGAGKYDLTTKYLSSLGVKNIVYDPYNRTPSENSIALDCYDYDTATLCNILNVIPHRMERIISIETACMRVIKGGKIYICAWVGNNSGNPKISKSNTWQANKKLESYIDEIKLAFPIYDIVIKSGKTVKYMEVTI